MTATQDLKYQTYLKYCSFLVDRQLRLQPTYTACLVVFKGRPNTIWKLKLYEKIGKHRVKFDLTRITTARMQ